MSGRGWALARAVAVTIATLALAPVDPVALVGLPAAVLLLAFGDRRPLAVGLAAGLLFVGFTGGSSADPLWYAERAWALLLAGGFVLATLWIPTRGLLARSLAALGVAFGAVGVVGLTRPALLGEVDWWIGARLTSATHTAYDLLGAAALQGLGSTIREVVRLQTSLYPALLALSSLGALAIGSYAVGRLRGSTESLAPLREFRFSDQLVWVLIAGLLLFLLPIGGWIGRIGGNAMAFMGGLYLLRGAAVLVWLGAALLTSTWTAVLWGMLVVLFYPVVLGAALIIGLGDTWLDLRRRLRPTDAAGEGGD